MLLPSPYITQTTGSGIDPAQGPNSQRPHSAETLRTFLRAEREALTTRLATLSHIHPSSRSSERHIYTSRDRHPSLQPRAQGVTGSDTNTSLTSRPNPIFRNIPILNSTRPSTLRHIERTTSSLRRITETIENAYRNLATARDNIRRTMDDYPVPPPTPPNPSSTNRSSTSTPRPQFHPNGDRDLRSTSTSSASNSNPRPDLYSSAFNSNMAPSHSAIILADGTEVIAPVNATSYPERGSTPSAISPPDSPGPIALSGPRPIQRGRWIQPEEIMEDPAEEDSNLSDFPEGYRYWGPNHSLTDTPYPADVGRSVTHDEFITSIMSAERTVGISSSYGGLARPNPTRNPSFPPPTTRQDETNTEYSSQTQDPDTGPNSVFRSSAEAFQSLSRFIENIRSTIDRVDARLDAGLGVRTLESHPTNQRSDTVDPRRISSTRGTSPIPEESLFETLALSPFRSRSRSDRFENDASTTLGRRVEARAAAAAAAMANSHSDGNDAHLNSNNRRPREPAWDTIERLERDMRMARNRLDAFDVSTNRVRRGSSSRTTPSGSFLFGSPPRTRPALLPSSGGSIGRAGVRRRRQDETPSHRARTSHIDRTGRLSYNPTLPEEHPLAYIHRNPSARLNDLRSHDFIRPDPATGRQRRYTVISPVQDGADGVHTITMSDSSSDDDLDSMFTARTARVPRVTRQSSPRRVRVRHQRTLSQGASRPLLERDRERERGNRRSVSRDRVIARVSLLSSDEDDENVRNGNRNGGRPERKSKCQTLKISSFLPSPNIQNKK